MIEPVPLPYRSLEPVVSDFTLDLHYGLYRDYVSKVRIHFSKAGGKQPESLEDAMALAAESQDVALLHNTQQAINHQWLWRSMTPHGGGEPEGPLAAVMGARWLSYSDFYMDFLAAATGLFGSGWLWLAVNPRGRIDLLPAVNSDQPWQQGEYLPLLVLDVWEHAYVCDYGGQRDRYVRGFLDTLINWEAAEAVLEGR